MGNVLVNTSKKFHLDNIIKEVHEYFTCVFSFYFTNVSKLRVEWSVMDMLFAYWKNFL